MQAMIDPDDARFAKPDDMPQKVADYCRQTGQIPPGDDGQIVRCVLESLALLYRKRLDQIDEISGRKLTTLHIVGGGSQNVLLNQFSANATGRTVIAGPVEATAIGNVLIQALALGHLSSLDALRDVVRQSFPVQIYHPTDAALWQRAYERFQKVTG